MVQNESVRLLDFGLPLRPDERKPAADALILAGGKLPKEYRQLFDSTQDAAIYYLRFQYHRFAQISVDRICKGCGQPTENVARASWHVNFQLPFSELSVNTKGFTAYLDTHHSVCAKCLEDSRGRFSRHWRAIAYSVALALLGVGYMMWSAYEPPWSVWLKDRIGLYFYLPPALLILAAVVTISLRNLQARHRLPKSLYGLVDGLEIGICSVPPAA